MHDPDFLILRAKVPVPAKSYPVRSSRWAVRRRRYTAPSRSGQPMLPIWRPGAWDVTAFGRHIVWWTVAEAWHHEPGGRDSGTVCKGHHGSKEDLHNLRWAWQHRAHITWRVRAFATLRSWAFQKGCAECGRRFAWREPRYGLGWDGPSAHRSCADLVHTRRQLDDATTFVLALSDAVHGSPDLDGIHGHEETVVRFDVACADGSVLHAAGLFDRDEAECWVRSTDYRRPCGPHRVVERHAPP